MKLSIVPPDSAAQAPAGAIAPPPPQRPASPDFLRALKAAFYREFRPHLPIAFSMLVLGAIVASLLGVYIHQQWTGTNILLVPPLAGLVALLCPAFGLALGIVQAIRDRSPENWALLFHRPVSPLLLFAGRILAGLALYGIVVILPLLALIALAASPAGGIPFNRYLAAPLIADMLAGLCFYGAGLVCMQRERPLLGLLAIIVALAVHVLDSPLERLWQAALLHAAFIALLLTAAAGAVYSNGYRLRARPAQRFAMGLIFFLAWMAIFWPAGLGLQYWNLNNASERFSTLPQEHSPDYDKWQNRTYTVLNDGSFALGTWISQPAATAPATAGIPTISTHVSFERLWPDKGPVDPGAAGRSYQLPFTSLPNLPPVPPYRNVFWTCILFDGIRQADDPSAGREVKVFPGSVAHIANEYWFFLSPPGLYYGYDRSSSAFIGTLGEDGFAPPGHTARPFGASVTAPNSWTCTVRDARGDFLVDFALRTTTLVHRFPPDAMGFNSINVSSAKATSAPAATTVAATPAAPGAAMLAVLSPHAVSLYADTLDPVVTLPLSRDPKNFPVILANSPRGWVLWYQPRFDEIAQVGNPTQLLTNLDNRYEFFDPAGKPLAHFDIPNRAEVTWSGNTLSPAQRELLTRTNVTAGIIDAFGGLPWTIVSDYLAPYHFSNGGTAFEVQIPSRGPYALQFWLGAGVTVLLLAVAMFFFARWYAAPLLWLWVLATLVCGPILFVFLASIRPFPRRIKCPACARRILPSANTCPHCRRNLPAPAPNGTEIFSGGAA